MSELVLLTAPNCHFCEQAKGVLAELGAPWHEVDSDSAEGRQLAATAPPMRPVLFNDHQQVLAYGRLSLKRLRRQLPLTEVTR